MGKLVLNPEFNLYEREGEPLCSSRQVAETFGKDHKNVLQSIKAAVETVEDFAADFSAANFFESRYKDRGKFYPEYLLTKDAFSYIVMGFTGKKRLRSKSPSSTASTRWSTSSNPSTPRNWSIPPSRRPSCWHTRNRSTITSRTRPT